MVTKETKPKRKKPASRPAQASLRLSKSDGTLEERIRRERRAHTMAPQTRLPGPIVKISSQLFASAAAPSASRVQSQMNLEDEFNDDYDQAPIVVKVRYDPQIHGKPSEEAVRQAIGHQLRQINGRGEKEPIVVNFLGKTNPLQTQPFPHIPPRPVIYRPASYPLPKIQPDYSYFPKPSRILKGTNSFLPIDRTMAYQTTNVAAARPQTAPVSSEMYRPSPVSDVPELSRDNLLNMLNQIPDLKGRQFKIEYASSGAPEAYPLPFHLESATAKNYPEPVVVDKLPNNVIQHVKTSNNPALAAALEAAIEQEHRTSGSSHTTLTQQASTTMHHMAQNSAYVQESRPVSSDESDTSTETSSSSDEETESEESELVALARA